MLKSFISSVRFGRTYSGSCALQFIEYFNQIYCWDANNVARIMFDFFRFVWIVLCKASTQCSSSDGAQLFGFASLSIHNFSTVPLTSVVIVALARAHC
jgi:hypothetical protein